MSPVGVDFDLEDLRDVAEGCWRTVPSIDLALVQVYCTTRGLEKDVQGPEKVPSNVGGGYAKKDGVIRKKGMIDGGEQHHDMRGLGESLQLGVCSVFCLGSQPPEYKERGKEGILASLL